MINNINYKVHLSKSKSKYTCDEQVLERQHNKSTNESQASWTSGLTH